MATYDRWSHREVRLYYKYPIVLHRAAKGTMESRFALPLRSFSIEYAREKKIARLFSKRLKAFFFAYDFYDGSFKTGCVFLVQSFTFYQELMVSGSEHPHPPRGGTQQKVVFTAPGSPRSMPLPIYTSFSYRNCHMQSSPILSVH